MKYRLFSVFFVLAAATMLMTGCKKVPTAPAGAFSIGEGRFVKFSPGNLRYRAFDDVYTFAVHQYEIVGMGNQSIAPRYDGWIDLFGWGTGSNPTLASVQDSDYYVFNDWGNNTIDVSDTNFHNAYAGTGWRTLSFEEWDYLLSQRPNAAALRGAGKVHNINGLIILPDNWNPMDTIHCALKSFSDNEIFSTDAKGDSIWDSWESKGAIFLPACGQREGTRVVGSNQYGRYWTSTPSFYHNAYFVGFMNAGDSKYQDCCLGRSVRLVMDVK